MKETKYSSWKSGNLTKGCKLCVKGRKMVLFVTGLCSRGCEFCPLSKLRKNVDKIYANERLISNEDAFNEVIEEVKISGAKGCSFTGGDPLLKLDRTIKLGKKLKEIFGKKFHIHIYLSTKLVTEKNLEKLSKCIDEVRFHPDFDKPIDEEIKKISMGKKFWKKKNIGIEVPCFPDKTKKIIEFIEKAKPYVSFLNLNELEAGEFSEKKLSKKYKLNEDGYTINNSIDAGKFIIKEIEKRKIKINVHFCTARLKNWHQYRERLKNYKILPFSKMTDEGTVIYFAMPYEKEFIPSFNKKDIYLDKRKNRIILNPKLVLKLKDKFSIYKIEEYPTFDREEAEVELLK